MALGKVDYYEALGFVDDPMATAHVWYRAAQLRLPPAGGRGHRRDGELRLASRTGGYEPRVRPHRWRARPAAAARLPEGRPDFATNGPLLELTIGGRGVGDELRLVGRNEVVARVSLRSNVAVDHLEIVSNGEVVREVPLAGIVPVPTWRSGCR